MKRILDPAFRYRPSFDTDIRKTIAEFKRREDSPGSPGSGGAVLYVLPPKRRSPK
jgi:hypothetical protein